MKPEQEGDGGGPGLSAPVLGSAVNQYDDAQAASSAIEKFVSECTFYLFPEGSMQFLDGGTLDLGIVRDSVLDATHGDLG